VVVRGERQLAVVRRPEELHPVEEDPVALLGVEPELESPPEQHVPGDEPIGSVGPHHNMLGVAGRRVLAAGIAARLRLRRLRVVVVAAAVDEDVLRFHA
jgi:hypothetical protein